MSEPTDLEKRARELLSEAWLGPDGGDPSDWPKCQWVLKAMRALGAEMADARAEEIAAKIAACNLITLSKAEIQAGVSPRTARDVAAAIARSTISKPEPGTIENPLPHAFPSWLSPVKVTAHDPAKQLLADVVQVALDRKRKDDEASIRADEREKIAARLQGFADAVKDTNRAKFEAFETAAETARCVQWKPKTREVVLEEALREIQHKDASATSADTGKHLSEAGQIARRALEWKP